MTWHRITGVLMLTAALTGCEKLSTLPFVGKYFAKGAEPAVPTAPAMDSVVAPADTAPPPAPPPPPVTARPRPVPDEPWIPVDTGTVSPGMTRDEVIAVWGVPVSERQDGDWQYLYFRNGCEVSCGTFDVVFLQGGQVVDAVVRGPGHTYTGQSSSPPDRMPEASLPTAAAAPIPDVPQ